MRYRLLFICFLIIGISLGQKRITVSDIYVDFRCIPKTVKGVNWMNDGRYYTAIENNNLVKYDVTAGERVETLVRGAELDPAINFSAYSFSSDEKKILFQTNRESIYRRSFKADYFVYDTESKKLVKLSEGGKQSYATFSPDATKVKRIEFTGNCYRKDQRLKKLLNSQEKSRISLSRGVKLNIFRNSKYLAENYKEDKRILMNYYHSEGYRDAQIVEDTIIFYNSRQVILKIELDEGPRYVIREISWLGNSKYGQEFLTRRLGVKTGDFYNLELINRGLYQDKQGRDISSLYMDDGYLQFSANPVDLRVKDDSIDLEIRIHEGPQYTIGKINI